MGWEESLQSNNVSLKICLDHINLFDEVSYILAQPINKKCLAIESNWFESFMSYGTELKDKE